MKKLLTIICASALLLIGTASYAQVPQKFNYQGVARDAKGNPMAKQQLSLKLTVLPTSDAINSEYEETQLVTTNEFGLYTLQIGNGTAVSGEMKNVKWETGNKYIRVAIDPKGGSNYVDAGTTQLLSVPYAIYADKAGVAKSSDGANGGTRATNNFIEKTSAAGVVNSNSMLFDNGTSIGLNTTSPQARFHIADAAATGGNTELRLQHQNLTSGASRLSFFNDAQNSFTATADYAVLNKYAKGVAGNYAPGFKFSQLFSFANSQGSLIFNTAGNIGFGSFNQATSTTTTRLFIDSLTGNVGVNTSTPASKFQVDNALPANTDNGNATFYQNSSAGQGSAISARSNSTGLPGGAFEYSRALLAGYQNTPIGTYNYGVWGHQTGVGAGGYGGIFSNGATMATATKYAAFAGSGTLPVATFMGGNVGIGTTTPNAPLQFENNTANRKIVLWEGADNGHQFYGFGVNGGALRYQVNTTSDNHIFYAGTATPSSNELMRIQGNGNVGIGTPTPGYKLHVAGSNPSIVVEENGSSNSNIIFKRGGVEKWYLLQNWGTTTDNIAFYDASIGGKVFQINPGGRIGIGSAVVNDPAANTYSMVQISNAPATDAALHVGDNTNSFLSYMTVNRPTTSTTSGIFRVRDNGNSSAFFDLNAATYQLTVYGSALASGGTWTNSDARLKKEIAPIDNALSNIKKLRPTTYYFKSDDEKYKYLNLPKSQQFGLIAQEVREVFPNIVNETRMKDEDGKDREESVLSMNYTELVPVLIKGMQEQQALIEKLEKRIVELEKK